jgi:hypothetical protein
MFYITSPIHTNERRKDRLLLNKWIWCGWSASLPFFCIGWRFRVSSFKLSAYYPFFTRCVYNGVERWCLELWWFAGNRLLPFGIYIFGFSLRASVCAAFLAVVSTTRRDITERVSERHSRSFNLLFLSMIYSSLFLADRHFPPALRALFCRRWPYST